MVKKQTTGANVGFEEKLWLGADKLRDTPFPKLLFGEININNVSKNIEGAV